VLQGWTGTHEDLLFGDGRWTTRREGELFIASRGPIGEVKPVVLGDDTGAPIGELGAAALIEVQTARGPIHLVNLHLASPPGGLNSMWTDCGSRLAANLERRWGESGALRELAAGVHGPLLLAGDFNTTSESPIFREHWSNFADAFIERGAGF